MPEAPTTATSSAWWTVRLTPFSTRRGSALVRYSFSTPRATRSGMRAPASGCRSTTSGAGVSLIAQHVDRVESRGLARRVERRQEREDQRGHRDQEHLRRVHLHRELRELVDVAGDLH